MKKTMKKTIAILLTLCLCVGLCACGNSSSEPAKSAEAQKADELILAIGEVTADSYDAISAAREHYDSLTEEQKAEVTNYDILVNAEAAYTEFQTKWSIDYTVDSAGQKTDDAYLIATFGGSSVIDTSVSYDLTVHVYYTPSSEMFMFRLLEHGTNKVRYTRDTLINFIFTVGGKEYKVQCIGSAPDGDVIFSSHYSREDSDLKKANNTDREAAYAAFLQALTENEGSFSCSMLFGPYYKVSNGFGDMGFAFTIETKGFGRLLSEINN